MRQINDNESKLAVEWIVENTMPFLSENQGKITGAASMTSGSYMPALKRAQSPYITMIKYWESIDFHNLVIIDGKTRAGYLKFRYRHYSTLPGDLQEALMVWFWKWWGV